MPIPVKVYRWHVADDPMPLSEDNWTMHELPAAGDRYWHGVDGFTVRDVDASQDEPVVNLVYDHNWMDEVHAALPGLRFRGWSIVRRRRVALHGDRPATWATTRPGV